MNEGNPLQKQIQDLIQKYGATNVYECITRLTNTGKDSLDRAQKNLILELKPFLPIYGKDMLNEFYRYWTEPNRSKTKCKYQLQQTWDTGRRLITWENNNAKKNR